MLNFEVQVRADPSPIHMCMFSGTSSTSKLRLGDCEVRSKLRNENQTSEWEKASN